MKLLFIQSTADVIQERAKTLQPDQVVSLLYIGQNYENKAIFALWYWENPLRVGK